MGPTAFPKTGLLQNSRFGNRSKWVRAPFFTTQCFAVTLICLQKPVFGKQHNQTQFFANKDFFFTTTSLKNKSFVFKRVLSTKLFEISP